MFRVAQALFLNGKFSVYKALSNLDQKKETSATYCATTKQALRMGVVLAGERVTKTLRVILAKLRFQ